ncbi:hypothetical protein ACFS07_14700 [Undibacterium arcticum]
MIYSNQRPEVPFARSDTLSAEVIGKKYYSQNLWIGNTKKRMANYQEKNLARMKKLFYKESLNKKTLIQSMILLTYWQIMTAQAYTISMSQALKSIYFGSRIDEKQ